jgi:CubicO group peptidase (beta-lactamase class C family)
MKKTKISFAIFVLMLTLFIPTQAQELSKEKIKEVEQLITEKMSKDRIPGLSIAIALNGKVIWSNGYGFSDLENFVPVKSYTAFRTASIGKPLTATAVMQLVEKGKIDLNAPIQNYCPAFPKKRWTVTTKHLLTHTSGISHYGGPNGERELHNTKHYEKIVDVIEAFKNDPLVFEPGTQTLYSTFAYITLGCVIEGASGMSYMDYMNQNVFKPAGMLNTINDDPYMIIPNRAHGYFLDDTGKLQNSVFTDVSNRLPAGGFLSTSEDLALFASALIEHKLVSQKTLEQMLTPQKTKDGKTLGFGLGWGLFPDEDWYGEKEAFHGGQQAEVSAMLYMIPRRKFAVAMQMNLENVSERTSIAAQIAKIVLELGKKKD